jgi:[ribosomal protein S5]-alanine N-acetyltransferase
MSSCPERACPAGAAVLAKGFRQTAASSDSDLIWYGHQAAITVGCEGETGLNVLGSQVWEIIQDLSDAHATTKVIENVSHRDSSTTNAGFAAANSRINADVLEIIHGDMVAQIGCAGTGMKEDGCGSRMLLNCRSMLFETPRLNIRDLQRDDFTDLLAISSDPEVSRTNDYLAADEITLREWLEATLTSEAQEPRNSHHSTIKLKSNNQMVGWIGLQISNDPQPGRVEFGYALGSAHWNQGYMTEAVHGMLAYCFDVLEVQTVTAFHLQANPSSGRVMLKAGMRLYDEVMQDRTDDEVHYVITTDEWWKVRR